MLTRLALADDACLDCYTHATSCPSIGQKWLCSLEQQGQPPILHLHPPAARSKPPGLLRVDSSSMASHDEPKQQRSSESKLLYWLFDL